MAVASGPITRALILSPDAGGVTDEVEADLLAGLPGFERIDFEGDAETIVRTLSPRALVVVAGGDGTVGAMARALSGSRRRLAIIPVGTYNNFATALGIPGDVRRAIALVDGGVAQPVTLGLAGDRPFLETASIGLFGVAVELGERVKEGRIRGLLRRLRRFLRAPSFDYRVSGDITATGRARSLVFTNTPTTGARLTVGDSTPDQRSLELAINVGSTRRDVLQRAVWGLLRRKPGTPIMNLRFSDLEVRTSPRLAVYADELSAGRTPVVIRALPGALHVMVPR